jgi:hypothetical protein
VFKEQNGQGDPNISSTIVNSFVSEKVDLILGNATPALQAAYNATETIPVLGTSITEYGVALGIQNFSGTVGNNISGTSDLAPLTEQAQMMIDVLKLGEGSTVGILYCSAEANSAYQYDVVSKYLKEKKITVKGTVSDGLVYLDISNNYTGTLSKAKNGNYLTTKENGKGLGLQSVAHLVKLHNGIFEVETTENIFRVSLMLRENADAPAQPVSP